MMKKFFKNPLEAEKSDAPSVRKVLKKIFLEGIEGANFFYKAEFNYKNGERAPFLYIGPEDSNWKKYTKASKKDKDFVAGVCRLEAGENGKPPKLLLKAEVGKGSKASFLKAVNKELLKKLSVKAEFVEELNVELEEEENEEGEESIAPTDSTIQIEELDVEFNVISEELKLIQTEHDEEQIDTLLDKIEDWEDAYKTLPKGEREKLASQRLSIRKVAAYLQKVNQIDSKINLLFDKIEVLIIAYLKIEKHTSQEALVLKKKVEKSIEKVETLAKKINDNDFIKVCQEFKKILAA